MNAKAGLVVKEQPSTQEVWSYRELRHWLNSLDEDQLDGAVLMAPGDGTVVAMKRPVTTTECGATGSRHEVPLEKSWKTALLRALADGPQDPAAGP